MKKSWFFVFLALVALVGCGGGGDGDGQVSSQADGPTDAVLAIVCPDRDADQADCTVQVLDDQEASVAAWQVAQGYGGSASLDPGCYTVRVEQTDGTATYYAAPRSVCVEAGDARMLSLDFYDTQAAADDAEAHIDTLLSAFCPASASDSAACVVQVDIAQDDGVSGWQFSAGRTLVADINPDCYTATVTFTEPTDDQVSVYGSGPVAICAEAGEEAVLDVDLTLENVY